MGTDPPRTVRLDLPDWLWGRSVAVSLRSAGLSVREAAGGDHVGSRAGLHRKPGVAFMPEAEKVLEAVD